VQMSHLIIRALAMVHYAMSTASKPVVRSTVYSEYPAEESTPTDHWLRIIFKDGSPPLEGRDAFEFVKRRVRSGNNECSEILHSTEIVEDE
jgi:hypothetical protein